MAFGMRDAVRIGTRHGHAGRAKLTWHLWYTVLMLSVETRARLVPVGDFTPEGLEERYPPRAFRTDAEVTRFGPSPTGYVHLGGILVALIAQSLAASTDGVFVLRIEDTDQNRYVEEAIPQLFRALEYLRMFPDESIKGGAYGPYQQTARQEIYDTYITSLLEKDFAYPCFCSAEDLARLTERQRAAGVPVGYWGQWAQCRWLSESEVVRRLDGDAPYVIRFRAPEFTAGRIHYVDRVRGHMEIDDNRNDAVIRKTMGLPTYHLAHPVDDHLMRVTTVVRADEWLSSVPLHLQLFAALGFEPPQYGHIAPILVFEGKSRRKLSKRKDPQANVDFYAKSGFPVEGVLCYLRGLANSRLQDKPWQEVLAAEIRLEECSASGQLLDLDKLAHICREVIADMTIPEIAQRLMKWADAHDQGLARVLAVGPTALLKSLSIEEPSPGHARKDLTKWSDFREKYGFLLPALFELVRDPSDSRFTPVPADLVREMGRLVAENYQHDGDSESWFDQVRRAAVSLGFSATVSEYRRNPDKFHGPLKDAANVIRVLLTGRTRSPDMYQASRILGEEEVVRRLSSLAGEECQGGPDESPVQLAGVAEDGRP
jgi:glutamyl-tRNA synthetase